MTENELFDIKIQKPSGDVYKNAKEFFDSLAKPVDGLGRFEDMICRIAAIQGTIKPDVSQKSLVIMCADNGVVREGVSQSDSAVTASVAKLMAESASTVCTMTAGYPVRIIPVDIGIDSDEKISGLVDRRIAGGTGNIAVEAAMTQKMCLDAIGAGIDMAKYCSDIGTGIIATGEMGIGNTTTSAALFCALTGEDPEDVTGRGAGLSDDGLKRKINVIERSLKIHGLDRPVSEPGRDYALSALSAVGGLDIAGLAGLFIGGALYHIPVVIDGAISAVSALAADMIVPGCRDYMIASHRGREACSRALDMMGLFPVIDADMALGEGTGAVMLFPLIDMIMSLYNGGTRFEETDIARYERFSV
ncbi:MAG: nicotinate-nucleotide--dimethylbenzimidazole phosphoribosyltransferase [Lachnospiraceae bacterium]|nr:nicotinate-nucleotide--dimethylbenzimidazole phosphoribosyltransferase [Lachnospiraceae bacterium]